MTTILAATAGLTVLVSQGFGRVQDGSDQVIRPPDAVLSTTTTDTSASSVMPTGAARVTGTITAMHLVGAVPDPREVRAPFTIVADRGFGNGATINGVTVEGTPATIEWDAGRPFVISSGGALVLDPVAMDLIPEGVRLVLADGVHGFTTGTYRLDTPVAVGTSGVAGARESVVFDASGSSRFEPRGDAALVLDGTEPRRLIGPGTVHLEGSLQIAAADGGPRAAGRLDVAEGAYELTITAVPGGGWAIDALLAGRITAA